MTEIHNDFHLPRPLAFTASLLQGDAHAVPMQKNRLLQKFCSSPVLIVFVYFIREL